MLHGYGQRATALTLIDLEHVCDLVLAFKASLVLRTVCIGPGSRFCARFDRLDSHQSRLCNSRLDAIVRISTDRLHVVANADVTAAILLEAPHHVARLESLCVTTRAHHSLFLLTREVDC